MHPELNIYSFCVCVCFQVNLLFVKDKNDWACMLLFYLYTFLHIQIL